MIYIGLKVKEVLSSRNHAHTSQLLGGTLWKIK